MDKRTPTELRALVTDRLDSKDWWVVPVASRAGIAFEQALNAHYAAAHDDDYDVVYLPVLPRAPRMPVVFAHKRACSHDELVALLPERARPHHTAEHDVLVPEDPGGDKGLLGLLLFLRFLDQLEDA